MLLIMMFRSSLSPNNIYASGDKNISWTKTTNSNQRHALSLSGINAHWLFPLMDGASEWTFGEQTIAPNFRKNDKPTNLIIVVMKVWWWENGNENAGLRETAPIFRGIPWAHSAWPLWGVVDASEALLRMRPSLGSPSFTLSIMRMHHKRELVFAAASAGLDLCDQSQSSPVLTWDNSRPTLHSTHISVSYHVTVRYSWNEFTLTESAIKENNEGEEFHSV